MTTSRYGSYKRSDPLESLLSYVMLHGGIDRHDRMLDIEWLKDVLTAARDVTNSYSPQETDAAIDKMRRVLRERY